MLDLETFGLVPGVALRSIGAVEFELSGEIGVTFYRNIDRRSCEAAGLIVDPNTEAWWKRQSQAAQDQLLVDPHPLRDVVMAFHSWFRDQEAVTIWSHGAAFDTVLWEAAARVVGFPTSPWKFGNVRDTRTVHELFGFDVRDVQRVGTYHNALDDAVYQVKCVAAALAKGRAPERASGGLLD